MKELFLDDVLHVSQSDLDLLLELLISIDGDSEKPKPLKVR